jgi:hypothetical protein
MWTRGAACQEYDRPDEESFASHIPGILQDATEFQVPGNAALGGCPHRAEDPEDSGPAEVQPATASPIVSPTTSTHSEQFTGKSSLFARSCL